jgi:hypothetical protein
MKTHVIPPTTRLSGRLGKLLPLTAAALLATGCSTLSYTSPAGEHFCRLSLGGRTAIAALSVEAGTNGIRRLELKGYQTDSNQALSTVTEAAVRAALTR